MHTGSPDSLRHLPAAAGGGGAGGGWVGWGGGRAQRQEGVGGWRYVCGDRRWASASQVGMVLGGPGAARQGLGAAWMDMHARPLDDQRCPAGAQVAASRWSSRTPRALSQGPTVPCGATMPFTAEERFGQGKASAGRHERKRDPGAPGSLLDQQDNVDAGLHCRGQLLDAPRAACVPHTAQCRTNTATSWAGHRIHTGQPGTAAERVCQLAATGRRTQTPATRRLAYGAASSREVHAALPVKYVVGEDKDKVAAGRHDVLQRAQLLPTHSKQASWWWWWWDSTATHAIDQAARRRGGAGLRCGGTQQGGPRGMRYESLESGRSRGGRGWGWGGVAMMQCSCPQALSQPEP